MPGGTLVAAGLLTAIVLVMSVLPNCLPDQRFVMSGEYTLELEPGEYTIFHEYENVIDDRVYSSPPTLLSMTVWVFRGDDGRQVELSSTRNVTYEYRIVSRSGVSIAQFEIDTAGTYRIVAAHAAGSGGPVVLAVGEYRIARVLTRVGLAIASAIGGGGLGGFLIHRARRRPKLLQRGVDPWGPPATS